jgi:hypothetical protein
MGVPIGTPWFPEGNRVGGDGVVPPALTLNQERAVTLPWYNWAIKGWKTINGTPYLTGKLWQGKNIGDNGWLYFDRDFINRLPARLRTSSPE